MDNAASSAPDLVRVGIGTSGPERNWPFNSWWVAAHASELSQSPILRWLLEMPLALYRTGAGDPIALHNRCPHRWAPLHRREVTGTDLICPLVEATQAMARCAIDQDEAIEFSVAADRAAVEGRRIVAAMVKAEREQAAAGALD